MADLFCDHVGNTVRQQRNVPRKAARISVASQVCVCVCACVCECDENFHVLVPGVIKPAYE